MTRNIILFFGFLFVLISSNTIAAKQLDNESPINIDTTIIVDSYKIRIQSLDSAKYMKLYQKHLRKNKPSTPIKDIHEVQKLLSPEFDIKYQVFGYENSPAYGITSIEKKGHHRILIEECEDFRAYYPKERVLSYFGGHSLGLSVNIDTGESVYNPEFSAISENGKYILGADYSGQEGLNIALLRYDKDKGEFVGTDWFDHIRPIAYDYHCYHKYQFWEGNTLYLAIYCDHFSKTYAYRSISISE